jgi:ribulose-phosphate 3-epimerase
MKIVPAILADTIEDCRRMLKQAESFTNYVQIDLMDGVFVPSRSFSADQVNVIESSVLFEIHLMVKNPSALMKKINHPHLRRVIFHFESDVNHLEFIREIKERGAEAGLAINPGTPFEAFRAISEHVNHLLFLTVEPGYYGSPFREDVLKKIEETRRAFPNKFIEVDGGISLDNLKLFVDLGVDAVCVGSRIFLKGAPAENYRRFVSRVEELKVR